MTEPYRPANVRVSHFFLPDDGIRNSLLTVLRAGWLDARPGGSIRRSECPGDDILFCISGKGRIDVNGRQFDLAAGELAWISGDSPHGHRADTGDPWSVMWFRIDGPDLTALRHRMFSDTLPRARVSDRSAVVAWFQRLFQILDTRSTNTDLRLNAAIGEFLGLLSRQSDADGAANLPEGIDILLQRFVAEPQRAWDAEDMTRIAGMSASQLRRLFRQHLNSTPRAYLRRQRLAAAQRLMLETDLSLQEIAVSCGFCDGYHFSRDFRRIIGRSPRQWRRTELGR